MSCFVLPSLVCSSSARLACRLRPCFVPTDAHASVSIAVAYENAREGRRRRRRRHSIRDEERLGGRPHLHVHAGEGRAGRRGRARRRAPKAGFARWAASSARSARWSTASPSSPTGKPSLLFLRKFKAGEATRSRRARRGSTRSPSTRRPRSEGHQVVERRHAPSAQGEGGLDTDGPNADAAPIASAVVVRIFERGRDVAAASTSRPRGASRQAARRDDPRDCGDLETPPSDAREVTEERPSNASGATLVDSRTPSGPW